jgi:hypothetical protein
MRVILALLLSSAMAACMGGGSRRPTVTPNRPAGEPGIEQQLRGRWNLTALETQGQPRRASGELSFDEFDNITVRAELDPGEAGVAPPRTVLLHFVAKAVVRSAGELSYLGLQQRASPEQMVAGGTDPAAWTHFSLSGDSLQIWLEADGRRVAAMTFARAQ